MIAPLRDLQISERTSGKKKGGIERIENTVRALLRQDYQRRVTFADGVDQTDDLIEFVNTEETVHIGKSRRHPVLVALHHAAGDDDLLALAAGLVSTGAQDRFGGLLAGDIDKRAGIDQNDVGAFRRLRQLDPTGFKVTRHNLGVDQVLGATQTDKSNANRHYFSFSITEKDVL